MSWEDILKDDKTSLFSLSDAIGKTNSKQKKKLKKVLQASEPTEFFGQEMTKLTELIDELKGVDVIKTDKKLNKEMKKFEEANLDIVATASKLRKEYETLYNQLRGLVYPKSKGKLGDK